MPSSASCIAILPGVAVDGGGQQVCLALFLQILQSLICSSITGTPARGWMSVLRSLFGFDQLWRKRLRLWRLLLLITAASVRSTSRPVGHCCRTSCRIAMNSPSGIFLF